MSTLVALGPPTVGISGNHYVDHSDRIHGDPGKGLTMYLNH